MKVVRYTGDNNSHIRYRSPDGDVVDFPPDERTQEVSDATAAWLTDTHDDVVIADEAPTADATAGTAADEADDDRDVEDEAARAVYDRDPDRTVDRTTDDGDNGP